MSAESIIIRNMQQTDLEFTAERTFAEGWQGETIFELATSFNHDPACCFIAEKSGQPVGMCMGVDYQSYGFLGGLIVLPEARGQGIGENLLMHTVRLLQSRGLQSIFLDGVLHAVPLYERCGFQKVCRSLRFRGLAQGEDHPHIEPMSLKHLDQVCALDRTAFGADRRHFLEHRLKYYPYLCKVAAVNGRVEGYIMGRLGHTLLAVGPWVASPRLAHPQELLEALLLENPFVPVSMGCLSDNLKSVEILRSMNFTEKADSPWRMVYGQFIQPGNVEMNFAIGSPAKG